MNTELLEFSEKINQHGCAMTLISVKGGLQSSVVRSMTPIQSITNGGALFSYLESVVNSIDPDKLIAVVKKRNGSSFKDSREFSFEKPRPIIHAPIETPGFSQHLGNPNTAMDPMAQMYIFKIENLEKELRKANETADKYEKFKEKYHEIKRDLDLVESKHKLDRERERVRNENTFAGTLKEFKPQIEVALSGLADKIGGNKNTTSNQTEQLGNSGIDPGTKLAVILNVFNSLENDVFDQYWEIMFRLGYLSETDRMDFLGQIQEKTDTADDGLDKTSNLKNK